MLEIVPFMGDPSSSLRRFQDDVIWSIRSDDVGSCYRDSLLRLERIRMVNLMEILYNLKQFYKERKFD